MKTFMAYCRFWFNPLVLLPLLVFSIVQDNWLAAFAALVAIFWAVACTLTDRLLDSVMRSTNQLMDQLDALHTALKGMKK